MPSIPLGEVEIGLDSNDGHISFLSHAHLDHIGPVKGAKKIIASEETKIISGLDAEFVSSLNGVELVNAGHMPGARQLVVENGSKIVYTGDLRLKDGILEKGAEIVECDELYIEATYGDPEFRFPNPFDVYAEIQKWLKENKEKIILFGAYKLGKSQELIKVMNEVGIVPVVEQEIAEINERYEKAGIKLEYESIGSEEAEELMNSSFIAVVTPKKAKRYFAKEIEKAFEKPTLCAIATGWALKYRFNVDRAFPLSDHADFYDIVEYIKQANPKKVNFMHGDGREIEDEIKCLTPTKIVSGTHP
ncbi:MAG: hypothetical protein ACPL06_04345 [Candidatus Anstonellales archaeon]